MGLRPAKHLEGKICPIFTMISLEYFGVLFFKSKSKMLKYFLTAFTLVYLSVNAFSQTN